MVISQGCFALPSSRMVSGKKTDLEIFSSICLKRVFLPNMGTFLPVFAVVGGEVYECCTSTWILFLQLPRESVFHCGVLYEDSLYSPFRGQLELHEDVKIYIEENYEQINIPVPQFGGSDPADIIHDFQRVRSSWGLWGHSTRLSWGATAQCSWPSAIAVVTYVYNDLVTELSSLPGPSLRFSNLLILLGREVLGQVYCLKQFPVFPEFPLFTHLHSHISL